MRGRRHVKGPTLSRIDVRLSRKEAGTSIRVMTVDVEILTMTQVHDADAVPLRQVAARLGGGAVENRMRDLPQLPTLEHVVPDHDRRLHGTVFDPEGSASTAGRNPRESLRPANRGHRTAARNDHENNEKHPHNRSSYGSS